MRYANTGRRDYSATPNWFSPDSDASKATSLFFAIIALDSGHFPKQVARLTDMLVGIFDGLECDKDGNRHLDQLTYHKAGIISNKDGKMVIVPPADVKTEKDEKSDIADRMQAISRILKYTRGMSGIPEKQLKYAMTGRKPTTRNGTVGKSLDKITRIVASIETAKEKTGCTDAFAGLIQKIIDETKGQPISPALHPKNYTLYRRRYGNGKYTDCLNIYGISFVPGDVLDEIATRLGTGPADHHRVTDIIAAATRNAPFPTTWFVPMSTALGMRNVAAYAMPNEYECEIRQYLSDSGLEISSNVTREYEAYGKTYINRVDTWTSANNYAKDLLSTRVHVAETVYDAMQAYAMYDSIKDEKVRDFLVKAGYLIKDWRPDPDLWLRAARLIPANFDKSDIAWSSYANNLLLTPEIHDGAIKVAAKCADGVLEHLADSISSDTVKDKLWQISKGENQK